MILFHVYLLGCTDPFACNYDPFAEYEDGSCIYPEIGFDCEEKFEGCYNDNGLFYPVGSEWFITDCEFYVCDDVNNHGLIFSLLKIV